MSGKHKLNKFNWYPGHIAKAERQLKERISVIDLIVELLDARIPQASRHKDLPEWAKNKPIITVLNKVDLADPKKTKEQDLLSINCKNPQTIKALVNEIEVQAQPALAKLKKQGIIGRAIRVMVVGYPNVGKSSLINALAHSKKAKVADQAGVTRHQQWIDVKSKLNLKLLDTPGIIPAQFYSEDQALKLALCNCLGESAFDHVLIAREGMALLESLYPDSIKNYYKIPDSDRGKEFLLESIAETKALIKDGELDINRATELFLHDFREARIGKFSLE